MQEPGTSGTGSAPPVEQPAQPFGAPPQGQYPPPQGQYPPPQGQYPPPQGQYAPPPPPRRELRIPLTNLPSLVKVLALCLCALGLIAALIMPWVHMSVDTGDEKITANYDGKLQRMDTPTEDDGAPDDLTGTLDDAGYSSVGDYYDRGLAVTGFILLFIILGAGIFLRLADVLTPRVSSAVHVALASVALLPAGMATVCGMRFVGGFGIAWDSLLDALDVDATIASYGGLAVAIIGMFIIALLVLELLRELRSATASTAFGPWPWSGPIAHRLVLALIVLAVVGLITVPLTPWVKVNPDDEDMGDFYQDEGLITAQADAGGAGQAAMHDAARDIRYTSGFFWLALVFSFVAVMALALKALGAYRWLVGGVTLSGAMLFLFPLFGLLSQVGFMGHTKDVEIALAEGDVTFAAYAPLVLAVVLLLAALVHLAFVARALVGGPRTPPPPPPPPPQPAAPAYPQWQQPAAAPPVSVELTPAPTPAPAPAEAPKEAATKQDGGDAA
jgi:hypothetical protein